MSILESTKNAYIDNILPEYEDKLLKFGVDKSDCKFILTALFLEFENSFFQETDLGFLADWISEDFSPLLFELIFTNLGLNKVNFKNKINFETLPSLAEHTFALRSLPILSSTSEQEIFKRVENNISNEKIRNLLVRTTKVIRSGSGKNELFLERDALTLSFAAYEVEFKKLLDEIAYLTFASKHLNSLKPVIDKVLELSKTFSVDDDYELGSFNYIIVACMIYFKEPFRLRHFLSDISSGIKTAQNNSRTFVSEFLTDSKILLLSSEQTVVIKKERYRLSIKGYQIASFYINKYQIGDEGFFSVGDAFAAKEDARIAHCFDSEAGKAFVNKYLETSPGGRKHRFRPNIDPT